MSADEIRKMYVCDCCDKWHPVPSLKTLCEQKNGLVPSSSGGTQ